MGIFFYYASIVSVIISSFIFIFLCFQLPSREQKILGQISTCNVLMSLSFALAFLSANTELAVTGINLSFLGGSFIGTCFICLLCVITNVKIPRAIMVPIVLVDLCFAGLGVTNSMHHFMYKDVSVQLVNKEASKIYTALGAGYHMYLTWYLICMIISMVIYIYCYRNKPHVYKSIRKSLTAFSITGLFCFICFFTSKLANLPYDLTGISVCIGTLALLLAIYRFRAVPIEQNAEDAILNRFDDIIIACDTNNRLVYANEKAKNIYNVHDTFVYGVNVCGISERLDEAIGLKKGDSLSLDGNLYVCELLDIKMGKQQAGVVHWFKNITTERNFIAETIKLKESAEKANIAKNEFLAQISHEMRSPINAILGLNELIGREASDDRILSYSGDINRSGQAILTLLTDLLNYSKIEAGMLDIVPVEYDLSILIKDLILAIKTDIDEKGLIFETEFDKDIPKNLVGDFIRIKQILSNILTNCIRYTERGSISLKLSYDDDNDGMIQLKISISDTGIGIKQEELPHIFDSFNRFTGAKHIEGTGLGLNVTKKLVDLMDGYILVDSIYGQGTNFHLIIPQKKVNEEKLGVFNIFTAEKPEKKVSSLEKGSYPGSKILVVDDNVINRRLAVELATGSGIDFDEAENAEEFLRKIKDVHYDLILLDQQMPGMNGSEALGIMLEDNTHMCVGVPVIAMTADAEPDSENFFMSCGFNGYLSKPINVSLYESILKKYLTK